METRPHNHVRWLLSKPTVDSHWDDSDVQSSVTDTRGRKFRKQLVKLYRRLRPYIYKWDPSKFSLFLMSILFVYETLSLILAV